MTPPKSEGDLTIAQLFDAMFEPDAQTEAEVRTEYEQAGLDYDAAASKVLALLERIDHEQERARVAKARESGVADRLSEAMLAGVRALGLSRTELLARIGAYPAQVAHRELEALTDESLESMLADLQQLDADAAGDADVD